MPPVVRFPNRVAGIAESALQVKYVAKNYPISNPTQQAIQIHPVMLGTPWHNGCSRRADIIRTTAQAVDLKNPVQ